MTESHQQSSSVLSRSRGHQPQERDVIGQVLSDLADIGPRPATSTAEARAAALIAAHLRRAHLEVGVQTFSAAAAPTAGLGLLAGIGVLATILGIWQPWPSLALTMVLLWLAITELRGPPTLAALLRRRSSQNVIGTRAASRPPRWRVVLLGHLDSPRILPARWARQLRLRLLATPAALVALAITLLVSAVWPGWLLILMLPGLLLAAIGLAIVRREYQADWAAGAVDGAGLAAAVAVAAQPAVADDLELWVVALGAGAAANAGLHALLRTYPFPPDQTVFINLPWLGCGTLTLVIDKDWQPSQLPDSLLIDVFRAASLPATPLAERRYDGERLDSARLHTRGYQAVSLVGLNQDGSAAGFRTAHDHPDRIDYAQVEAAVSLIIRTLEQINHH